MAKPRLLSSGRYQVQVRVKGYPAETRTFSTEKEASFWWNQRHSELKAGLAKPDNADRKMLFRDAIDYYLTSFRYLQKKDTTQRNEAFKAETLKQYLGDYAVENITTRVVREFRDIRLQCKSDRYKKELSADTVRLELSLISIIFRSLRRDLDLDVQNPVNDVDIPKGKQRKRRLTEKEEMAISLAFSHRKDGGKMLDFFRLALATGMRANEIQKTRISDVELNEYDEPAYILLKETKNTDTRRVPLLGEAFEIVKKRMTLANGGLLFFSLTEDKQPRLFDYQEAWKSMIRKTGINDLHFHDVRHEYLSRLFEHTDMSDGVIASLSGHRSHASLWRYKHLRNEEAVKHLTKYHNKHSLVGGFNE